MVTLSELLGAGVEPETVVIGGKKRVVRMLTAAETLAIARLEPEPVLRTAPGVRATPEMEAALGPMRLEHEAAVKCLEAAAAIGYATKSGAEWDPRRPSPQWAKEAKEELLGHLSQEQVMELWTVSKRLAMTSLMESARGN